jgi:glycosyltransferase involved in cell wall biosynthesis
MLVSVIIPVYNVEKFIHQCIDSVLCQTYETFEVILVDDGSPDFSGVICDEYAKKDHRVSVIHKANGGLSDARNVGLEQAKGEYIIFMDSDDFWIDNHQLELLVAEIEKTPFCDFIGFNCCYYYSNTNKLSPWISYSDEIINTTERDSLITRLVQTGIFPMSACLKIIKRAFLIENNIRFIKGIVCEDIPWFIELLHCSRKFRVTNQYMYAYRQNVQGSITRNFSENSFDDLFSILQEQTIFIQSSEFSLHTKSALLSFMAYEFCILLGYIGSFDDKFQKSKRADLLSYKWLLTYTENPKVRKVSLCNRLFGIYITENLLRKYLKNKLS